MYLGAFAMLASLVASAQDEDYGRRQEKEFRRQNIQTVFRTGNASGGYGAITNKFTTINGQFANISGIYGGVYINHWFMIGVGAAATTNNHPVPVQFSADPSRDLSYEYGQFGLVTEYVIGSPRAIHVAFNLFTGAGFTFQYQRYGYHPDSQGRIMDENWLFVAEPGVQLEMNLFRWMRFCPGVSYRSVVGSKAAGLSDSDLSNLSYNATLKFGRF